MKILLIVSLVLLAARAQANTLSWTNGSTIASGTAVEILSKGSWTEVARVPLSQTSYVDVFSEGVYRVRHYMSVSGGADVFSDYSVTGVRLGLPILIGVK